MAQMRRLGLWFVLLMLGGEQGVQATEDFCTSRRNAAAMTALESEEDLTISYNDGLGYQFHATSSKNASFDSSLGGARGLVILPEDGVPPEAYASYARSVAKSGYYVVVVEKPTSQHALEAMKQQPLTQFWSLAGHGKGGEVAALLSLTLQPRVKSLVLLAAALPIDVDLRSVNLFVAVVYFGKDDVVTPESVVDSFSRMSGDTTVQFLSELCHHSFGDVSQPHSNNQLQSQSQGCVPASDSERNQITTLLVLSLFLAHWPVATEKALTYGDNQKLTPGHNDSKIYPGDIRVKYAAVPIPGTNPQRLWWVFTPSQIKGGLIYYAGAAVDSRAYWPLAFEIAARGHLVVIPQQPMRYVSSSYTDANAIIDSELSIFAGVLKTKWAIGGHSLGGVGASMYATHFGERIYAGVLHSGGWITNMTESTLPMAQIYGTLDNLLGGYDRYRTNYLPYVNLAVTKFIPITNGNHAQVGDYGPQSNDQIATMSLEDQHSRMAEETVKFLDEIAADVILHSSIQRPYIWSST